MARKTRKIGRKEKRRAVEMLKDLADQLWVGDVLDLSVSWDREYPHSDSGPTEYTITWVAWELNRHEK